MTRGDHLSDKGKRDLRLVERALSGDQSAYGELMDIYRESVHFMMSKMVHSQDDVADLTMEAFGKAFNRLRQYSPDFAFSTWLFKIASNNAIDFVRKKRIQLTSIHAGFTNKDGDTVEIEPKSGDKNPAEVTICTQKAELLRETVKKLRPRYRDLIEKRYFEELSYEEIAVDMQLPLGTVKAQLFRARAFLADIMEQTKDAI